MGIFGSLKLVVNSTLGTSTFQPLDKLIEASKTFLSNKIDNNQTNIMNGINNIKPSTTGVGKVLEQRAISISDVNTPSGVVLSKFIAPVSGLYKINIEFTTTDYSYGFTLKKIPSKVASYINEINNDKPKYLKQDGFLAYQEYGVGERIYPGDYNFLTEEILKSIETTISGNTKSCSGYFNCQAGEATMICLDNDIEHAIHISNIKITITYGNS